VSGRGIHDWKILNARNMLQTKLDPDHNVRIRNIILSASPFPDPGRQAVLIGILPASEQLVAITRVRRWGNRCRVFGDVDGVVGET
jgi:hypothetical protein